MNYRDRISLLYREKGKYIAILNDNYRLDGSMIIEGDTIDSVVTDVLRADRWVTINGSHVLINDKTGKILAGMGGKFNGFLFGAQFADKGNTTKSGKKIARLYKPKKQLNSGNANKQLKEEKARTVYGRYGGKYSISEGNSISLEGVRHGERYDVPANKNNKKVLAVGLPDCSGFKDGKYVIDENKNTILTDGRVALNNSSANNNTRLIIKNIVQNEVNVLGGVRENGVFYRGTDNDKEIDYIRSGKLRNSKNYMTGQDENGVSVWEINKYSFKHIYKVIGEVIDRGSDGEPTLKPKSIKLIKEVSGDDLRKAFEKGKREFCKRYNWTEEQLEIALKDGYSDIQR